MGYGSWCQYQIEKVLIQSYSHISATIVNEALAVLGIFAFLVLAYYLTTSKAGA